MINKGGNRIWRSATNRRQARQWDKRRKDNREGNRQRWFIHRTSSIPTEPGWVVVNSSPRSPAPSLKGSDVLFYHSKQVFTLEGASKTTKCNSFIVQIEKTMSLRAFYQSDNSTRSWWLARCIHRNNGNYSYTFQYIFLWLWYNEILPLCNWDFTILDHFEKETKGTKEFWTQN